MRRYVLDTNLYIRADRDERWADELDRFTSAFLPLIALHACCRGVGENLRSTRVLIGNWIVRQTGR